MAHVACVTGATGVIGRPLVRQLVARGCTVRVLTRRATAEPGVQVFRASLSDVHELERFIAGADVLFHCAGELTDTTRMHEVNVEGTRNVAALVRKHRVRYFCHLSSAGVIGRTAEPWVDECSPCRPEDSYERSKLDAELCAREPIEGCRTVILRPTNVVDVDHLGELALPAIGSLACRLKAFIKGGECAHIVHAEDVARAALYFVDRRPSVNPGLYFVSLDDDPRNTVAHLWSLYNLARRGLANETVTPIPHLPSGVPHVLRRMVRNTGNPGSVRYSSTRLVSEGFRFSLDVPAAVARVVQERLV